MMMAMSKVAEQAIARIEEGKERRREDLW